MGIFVWGEDGRDERSQSIIHLCKHKEREKEKRGRIPVIERSSRKDINAEMRLHRGVGIIKKHNEMAAPNDSQWTGVRKASHGKGKQVEGHTLGQIDNTHTGRLEAIRW